MRVGERHERVERAVVEPGVRVEQQHIPPVGALDACVPAGGKATVLLLDELNIGKTLAHERDGAVARAVVDDDRLDVAHARERLLDPRQRVVRHDHDRRVTHRGTAARGAPRNASHPTIAAPGSESATVTTKNRKPVANARSAETPSAPRNETKKDSRTASPLTVNGTSMTRKSNGPITEYGRGESSTPTALPAHQIASTRTACTMSVSANIEPSSRPFRRNACSAR